MTQRRTILLIEDEADVAAMIKLQADISGYKLHVESDGINGFRAIERDKPDLAMIDIMLPGMNGLDVCRKVKRQPKLKDIPIIIVTAKNEELDIVLGLELGADDYIVKPFSPKILFSRVKAILRRKRKPQKLAKIITFGEFTLEVDHYLLRKHDKHIPVTLSEFGILRRFLTNRGKILTRNQLLENVHNEDAFIMDRNIDVHIASLRKKLGHDSNLIKTVRGIGYRFHEEEFVEV